MCAHTPSSPPHRPNHTSDCHCRSSCLLQPPWGASLVRPGQSGEPEGAKRADWWVTGGGTRNHEERFSRTRFRRVPGETAPGGTAPGHGHKSGSRWLCSRDRRRAGPGPPGGNVESCPCTGHLGKEEASGHKVHPLEECCPLCWSSFPPTPPLTPSSWGARGAGVITRALAAGLAVTGPFPGGPQMSRAAHAERLVGSQALDLPRLHTTLAGARTLGSPQLPRQTFAPGSS